MVNVVMFSGIVVMALARNVRYWASILLRSGTKLLTHCDSSCITFNQILTCMFHMDNYCAQTKLWKSNVFTPVCQSPRQTPPGKTPPRQAPPPPRQIPPRQAHPLSKHPLRQTPHPPPHSPPDGHCSGRYAS